MVCTAADNVVYQVALLSSNNSVMLLENFLQKCSMGYTLYLWILLLEPTLETSYKPQT